MRKILFSLVISLITVLFACDSVDQSKAEVEADAVKTTVLAENKAEVKMEIDGMVCAMGCAKYIEDEVAGLSGVVASTVDFNSAIATFEYDKSSMSAEDIQSFINDIHDGQYKASLMQEQVDQETATEGNSQEAEVEEESSKEEGAISAVSKKINFSFPELLTYFLKQLR